MSCLLFLKVLFFQRKLQFIAKKFDKVRFCVRPLCELQLCAALDANDICNNPYLELWYRHDNLSAPLHRFFQMGGQDIPTPHYSDSSMFRNISHQIDMMPLCRRFYVTKTERIGLKCRFADYEKSAVLGRRSICRKYTIPGVPLDSLSLSLSLTLTHRD